MFVSFKSAMATADDRDDDLPAPFARPSFSNFLEVSQRLFEYVSGHRGQIACMTDMMYDEDMETRPTPLGLCVGA